MLCDLLLPWTRIVYITYLHCALASGTVYCNWSCLFVALLVCYHDKLEIACIDLHQTGPVGEGTDPLELIKFWTSCAPGKGSTAGRKFLAPPYYSQCAVFVSLRALFQYAA